MSGRIGRRRSVLLVTLGVALLCAAPAGAKVRSVAENGVASLGKVRCGAVACTVRAPSRARVALADGGFRAKVLVPRRVAAHAVATVRVKLGAKALERLAGKTGRVEVRVVLRSTRSPRAVSNRPSHARVVRSKKMRVVRAKIGRPASPETGSGGGAGPAAPSTPTSTPVAVEPPLLARPATAVTVGAVTLSWMPRDSRVRYVSSGTAAADGVVPGGGATGVASSASPCPDRLSSSSASLDYAISFPAKESWYDPLSGEAGIYGSGSVAFRYTAHTINLTAAQPEIEIAGAASRAIFRFAGSGGTPYPSQRVALETLDPTGRPTVTNGGKTLTYDLMRGTLTADGENVFAGFYTAPGDAEFGCASVSFTLP
jgi:hypothetical protein